MKWSKMFKISGSVEELRKGGGAGVLWWSEEMFQILEDKL